MRKLAGLLGGLLLSGACWGEEIGEEPWCSWVGLNDKMSSRLSSL